MAVVEDRDKTHPQDQILTTSISMNNDYTRDLINKVMAAEAVETENQRRRRCHVPLPTVRHVQPQQQRLDTGKIDCGEEDCELSLELSLGLSLNGRFGFDPNSKKIKRTTSIPESSMIPAAADGADGSGGGNLIRTCSLPAERPAESREEWLKRKELQSHRRMEARRRKNEKKRQSRTFRERSSGSAERGAGTEGGGENSNNNNTVEQGASADGLIRTTSLVRRVGGIVPNNLKEIDQVVPVSPPPSGGSIGGGSSSGTSETEVQQGQGRIPMDIENSNSGNIVGPQNKTRDLKNLLDGSSSSKIAGPQIKAKAVRNPLDDMPSVTTKGSGPNGRRIEGFLYKYGKGKDVRIVCVCHGSFLTPAEFVRHAGGGDVPNPLQQIVVNSSSS